MPLKPPRVALEDRQILRLFRPSTLDLAGLCRTHTIDSMKVLPWIALSVLAVVAALIFRYQSVIADKARSVIQNALFCINPYPGIHEDTHSTNREAFSATE
jgi:hypothetical protein